MASSSERNLAPVRTKPMQTSAVIEQLFNHFLNGDRPRARQLVGRVLASGVTPAEFANDVVWPLHETLFTHRRKDEVAELAFNYAVRLLRTTVDQLQPGYAQAPRNGGTVLLFSGRDDIEDLGGQIAADLLEAAGWEVWFGGPLVATDDVLAEVHARRPKWLVLFSSSKDDAARAREVIRTIREIGGHPDLRVALGGGIFNRAPGLAEELGADASAANPFGLAEALSNRTLARESLRVAENSTSTNGVSTGSRAARALRRSAGQGPETTVRERDAA